MWQFFRRRNNGEAARNESHDGPPPSGSTTSRSFPSGIKLLHRPKNSVADIVFIHGLTGDREKTWLAKDAESPWPQALLPSKIPDARILTFGYDANVTDWRGVVSQSRIANHAWNLLTALSSYREEDETNQQPIFFVCHSLGGLVCEDALVTASQRREQHLQSIIHSTRGILFLGTPHHGSGLARWAETLARSLGYIKQINTQIVEVLKKDSEVLARIQDSFHTMIMGRIKDGLQPIQITCFYEELPLKGVGLVVPQDSAILPGYIPIGIHGNHMDMARFSDIEDPGFVAVCGELRRWVRELRPLEATPADADLGQNNPGSAAFMVPFGRNRDFVGRESIMKHLRERVPPYADKDDCQRTAIEGLGGVGKTQIALEAAFLVRDDHPDCSIFWVPAIDATSFENAYRKIGQQLQLIGVNDDKVDVKVRVKAALSNSPSYWLLIVDNADDVELFGAQGQLSEYLPFSPKGSILFTTRNHKVVMELDIRRRNIITMTEMTRNEAVELLKTNLRESQMSDAASTASLLDMLAALPLAVKQASSYMAKEQISTSEYLNLYQSSNQDMVNLLSHNFEDRHRYKDIQNPVATTWLISFRHISEHDPLAARYLRFMCFLAEKDIPRPLLPPAPPLDALEAIGTLKAYAFTTQREGGGSFDMHRLVRLAMRNQLEEQLDDFIPDVIERLAEVFPHPEHENRDLWLRYLPHVLNALEFRSNCTNKNDLADLLYKVASCLRKLGKYQEAERMYRETLELDKGLGRKYTYMLNTMNNLANTFADRGNYNDAEQMLRETLALMQKAFGNEHPSVLAAMNNLAHTLQNQGNYNDAEQIHREVLKLRHKLLGFDHFETLSSMHNLAMVFTKQKKYKEAEKMSREALELSKRVLDHGHPTTLTTMNGLANILFELGRHKEAETLYRQTLEGDKRFMGLEHPITLRVMVNLGFALDCQRQYDEAERLHRSALDGLEKSLGHEHPDTQWCRDALAWCLRAKERMQKEA